MRVLVTGGAGFIGTRIVEALREQGHEVRVLDALLPAVHGGRLPDFPDDVEFIHGDVRDPGTVEAAISGVDVVCHQAAMVGRGHHISDAPEYASINDMGTAILLAAMTKAGMGRLVFASSVVIYGEGVYTCAEHGRVSPGPRSPADVAEGRFDPLCPRCGSTTAPADLDEDDRLAPLNVYGATKLAQEHLVGAWARETGGTAVALRYHQVYGPGMSHDSPYSGVTCVFRSVLQNGQAIELFEDGAMRRDFIHVRDIALANVAAIGVDRPGFRAYNVATGAPRTVGQLAHTLTDLSGGPAPVITGRCRFDDVRHLVASPARLRSELGWAPTVAFEDGMKEFATAPMRT
ncbi:MULTISPECIES: NAD-dependent epimerase/dehydratase family protein [unclassified Nonomuraea]|uniref:NAD-dependent epimerase/dehydratase family protein n=1 Tax=unclassified Nonomuraea TaxID=2593643 RepID=UPI003409A3C7